MALAGLQPQRRTLVRRSPLRALARLLLGDRGKPRGLRLGGQQARGLLLERSGSSLSAATRNASACLNSVPQRPLCLNSVPQQRASTVCLSAHCGGWAAACPWAAGRSTGSAPRTSSSLRLRSRSAVASSRSRCAWLSISSLMRSCLRTCEGGSVRRARRCAVCTTAANARVLRSVARRHARVGPGACVFVDGGIVLA